MHRRVFVCFHYGREFLQSPTCILNRCGPKEAFNTCFFTTCRLALSSTKLARDLKWCTYIYKSALVLFGFQKYLMIQAYWGFYLIWYVVLIFSPSLVTTDLFCYTCSFSLPVTVHNWSRWYKFISLGCGGALLRVRRWDKQINFTSLLVTK